MPITDVVVCTKNADLTGSVKAALEKDLAGKEIKVVEHNAVRLGFLKTPCQRYGAYVCENGDDAHVIEVYTKAFHRQAWLDKLICIVSKDADVKKYAQKDGFPCFDEPSQLADYLKSKN
jgi:hypothetical protein